MNFKMIAHRRDLLVVKDTDAVVGVGVQEDIVDHDPDMVSESVIVGR
jgi:hypothetical protein